VTSTRATADPPLSLVFKSLLRADFLVFLQHRRAVVISLMLPVFVLLSTSGNKATDKFGGAEFVIGLAIAYGLLSTSLIGYALTVARDREKGVFQRLRVTPAPTWTIMASRLTMQEVANLIIAIAVVIIGGQMHHISPTAGQYALVLLVSILAGAVFLSIAQALVGLVRSADSVQAVARVLFAVLILLGLLGQSGAGDDQADGRARTLAEIVAAIARDADDLHGCFGSRLEGVPAGTWSMASSLTGTVPLLLP